MTQDIESVVASAFDAISDHLFEVDCDEVREKLGAALSPLIAEYEGQRAALTEIARWRTELGGDFSLGSKQSDIARKALMAAAKASPGRDQQDGAQQ